MAKRTIDRYRSHSNKLNDAKHYIIVRPLKLHSSSLSVGGEGDARFPPNLAQTMKQLLPALLILGFAWSFSQAPSITPELRPDAREAIAAAPDAAKYPESAAVVLLAETDFELREDGKVVQKVRSLTKALNDRGVSSGEVALPYSGHYDRLIVHIAHTVLPNGQVVPVRPGDIRDTPVFSGQAMYEDTRQKTIVFPQAVIGATFELEYELVQSPRMSGFFFDEFWLQASIPVLRGRNTYVVRKGWNVRHRSHLVDLQPRVTKLADGGTRYDYEWASPAEVKPEPYMPPQDRVFGRVEFATTTKWAEVDAWWQRLSKGREALSADAEAVVKKVASPRVAPIDRLRGIYYWVQRNIRYVAIELGESGYQPHSAGQVCSNRYGDCKDLSTVLVGMLRKAGIKADWTLISIDSAERPPDERWAGPYSFNHCIARAQIGQKVYWLDATAGMLGVNELPSSLRGCKGLVIGTGGKFETLPGFGAALPEMETVTTVTVRDDGSARLKMRFVGRNDVALGLRQFLSRAGPEQIRRIKEGIVRQYGGGAGKLVSFSTSSHSKWDEPMAMACVIESRDYVYRVGNIMLISLDPDQSVQGGGSSLFSEPTREFPIYSTRGSAMRNRFAVDLPPGYEVLALPDFSLNRNPLMSVNTKVEQKGQVVSVQTDMAPKDVWIPKDEYEAFQTEYTRYAKNRRQVIVLRKKEPF